jgi:tripartite-type tricarboxylate transporter receptor subunit TctC
MWNENTGGYPGHMNRIVILTAFVAAGAVCAQEFPAKQIRIYTTTAGGPNDLIARLVASGMASNVNWTSVVDNRPSALIAADIVAKAPADGYSLLVTTDNLWIGTFLQKVPYDPVRDFSPITIATRAPNILVVHPSLPVKTVKDLISLVFAEFTVNAANWPL